MRSHFGANKQSLSSPHSLENKVPIPKMWKPEGFRFPQFGNNRSATEFAKIVFTFLADTEKGSIDPKGNWRDKKEGVEKVKTLVLSLKPIFWRQRSLCEKRPLNLLKGCLKLTQFVQAWKCNLPLCKTSSRLAFLYLYRDFPHTWKPQLQLSIHPRMYSGSFYVHFEKKEGR